MDDGITLDELSERTGVERRTLRSWVAEGLIAPPDKTGRGARYPEGNVARALAVRALKEGDGLSFAEIRRRLWLAGDEELAAIAARGAGRERPTSSLKEYLASVRAGQPADRPSEPQEAAVQRRAPSVAEAAPGEAPDDTAEADSAPALGPAGLQALIAVLEGVAKVPPGRRRPTTEWRRIPITPDLELAVRGDVTPKEQEMLERVADLIRSILTGGLSHDD